MSQTMRLSTDLVQSISMAVSLSTSFGEKSGDIPMFSLHRIKSRLQRCRGELGISVEVLTLLLRCIVAENIAYKKASGNDWSCLTSLNVVNALLHVEEALTEVIDQALRVPSEQQDVAEMIRGQLLTNRDRVIHTIKEWFWQNQAELAYDMNGKIPWAVVMKLRRSLAQWVVGIYNPFEQDISEMVLEVAREQGIDTGSAEDAWEQMGGRLFTKKESTQ